MMTLCTGMRSLGAVMPCKKGLQVPPPPPAVVAAVVAAAGAGTGAEQKGTEQKEEEEVDTPAPQGDDEDSDLDEEDDDPFAHVVPAAAANAPGAGAADNEPGAGVNPDVMPTSKEFCEAYEKFASSFGTVRIKPEYVLSIIFGAWTATSGARSTSSWPEGLKTTDDSGVKIAVETRNTTGKFVLDVLTKILQDKKDPKGGRLRAILRYQEIYKIVVHNDGKSVDIHLDNSPVFQYRKYAGQSGTQGKWTNLTAGRL